MSEFAQALAQLRIMCGKPTYAQLRRMSQDLPPATVSNALSGLSNPRLEFVEAFVAACQEFAATRGIGVEESEVSISAWQARWRDLQYRLRDVEANSTGGRTAVRPMQVPAPTAGFVGRCEELEALDGELDGRGEIAPSVVAVSGVGGVGKSALAFTWARSRSDRFPDGQLFADLRGVGPARPKSADEVLSGFLQALGHDPASLPVSADELAALYRTSLDGRRMLIVLDNAASSEQVRPLIPGTALSSVLVTSRDRLRGLAIRDGASLVHLRPMPEVEAVSLLRRHGSLQVEALDAVARRCGYLPLALRLVADGSHDSPTIDVDGLLWSSSPGADPDVHLTGVFEWSLEKLPDQVGDSYRLLGHFPGDSFDDQEVAAFLDLRLSDAAKLTRLLADLSLLMEGPEGVYRYHDLLHEWVIRSSPEAVAGAVDDALARLCGGYLWSADRADRILLPGRSRPPLTTRLRPSSAFSEINDVAEATMWVRNALPNLLAASEFAVNRVPEFAILLPHVLMSYFNVHKPWDSWMRIARAGQTACGPETPHTDAANVANVLGIALREVGSAPEVVFQQFTAAQRLYEAAGENTGAAMALNNIAHVLSKAGDQVGSLAALDEAIQRLEGANDAFRLAILLHGRAERLNDLGDFATALDCAERALDLSRSVGDSDGATITQVTLAHIHANLGHDDLALGLYRSAIGSHVESGNRFAEAEARHQIGLLLGRMGNTAEGRRELRNAEEIRQELRLGAG